MINKLTYIESDQYNPYKNLAVEEHLFFHCQKEECILYLWQNQHTIVIGRNQNAWAECLTEKLENDGGFLARRLSGGGAVYHDLGNLNFTFLVNKENYNVDKQLEVIQKAVAKFGVRAEKSGRNDILIDGRKFSGNAFYKDGAHCYHHGTIMLDVKVDEMSKYLTVSKEKLQSKGVSSVKSRVVNIKELVPDITVDRMKEALKEAFSEVYGEKTDVIKMDDLDQNKVEEITDRLKSWEWCYGRKIPFNEMKSRRFDWGQISLNFYVQEGRVEDIIVYTDALKPAIADEIPKYLKGLKYKKDVICTELGLFWSEEEVENKMMKDIIEWLKSLDW